MLHDKQPAIAVSSPRAPSAREKTPAQIRNEPEDVKEKWESCSSTLRYKQVMTVLTGSKEVATSANSTQLWLMKARQD